LDSEILVVQIEAMKSENNNIILIYKDTDMSIKDTILDKIQQMPEPLAEEVSDYIDFLLMKHDNISWQSWIQFSDSLKIAESDFSDYLSNLEDYEDRLVRGEIRW